MQRTETTRTRRATEMDIKKGDVHPIYHSLSLQKIFKTMDAKDASVSETLKDNIRRMKEMDIRKDSHIRQRQLSISAKIPPQNESIINSDTIIDFFLENIKVLDIIQNEREAGVNYRVKPQFLGLKKRFKEFCNFEEQSKDCSNHASKSVLSSCLKSEINQIKQTEKIIRNRQPSSSTTFTRMPLQISENLLISSKRRATVDQDKLEVFETLKLIKGRIKQSPHQDFPHEDSFFTFSEFVIWCKNIANLQRMKAFTLFLYLSKFASKNIIGMGYLINKLRTKTNKWWEENLSLPLIIEWNSLPLELVELLCEKIEIYSSKISARFEKCFERRIGDRTYEEFTIYEKEQIIRQVFSDVHPPMPKYCIDFLLYIAKNEKMFDKKEFMILFSRDTSKDTLYLSYAKEDNKSKLRTRSASNKLSSRPRSGEQNTSANYLSYSYAQTASKVKSQNTQDSLFKTGFFERNMSMSSQHSKVINQFSKKIQMVSKPVTFGSRFNSIGGKTKGINIYL